MFDDDMEEEEDEYELEGDIEDEMTDEQRAKFKLKLKALRAIYGPPETYPKYTPDNIIISTN